MYKCISQQKLVQICTHLYLTRSRYQYVQISPSQDAGTNMYKSLSYKEPVQNMNSTNLSPTGSWYKYVQISLSQEPVQICTSLYLTRSPVPVCTSLSLTGSGYNRYESLSHKEPAPICKTLSLSEIEIVCTCPAPGWSIHIHRNIPVDG